MKFGRVSEKDLKNVDFSLPPDPAGNKAILSRGSSKRPVICLGCAKWGRTEWIGKIYPKGTKEKDFLSHYARHYDTIELNATHYKIYEPEKIEEWVDKVDNKNFIFCPKAHRGMSYMKDSPVRNSVTKDFIKNIRHFGKNLGPIFITHDEKIKWDTQAERDFFNYLENLPTDLTFFVEERNPVFFTDKLLKERYYKRLTELNVGAVITDTAARRDVLHMHLTIPKAFIRFTGNSLHPTDFPRIDQWAKRFKKWLDGGIEEIYFFMHMHDEAKSPELTQYVVEQINKFCKINMPEVKFVK